MPVRPAPEARSSRAIALMYHALDDGQDSLGQDLQGQDRHYTLTVEVFRRQLERIARDAGAVVSARDWLAGTHAGRVLLTFDDGHISNYRLAFPMLLERGMRADFFINPANVGRPGFADWTQLRQMAAAGMSIQSHGYEHRYLTHLAPDQLRESLSAARIEIQDRIGMPVTLLAPPGGRMPKGLGRIARECGYSHVLGSRPGRVRHGDGAGTLPRLAVTADMQDQELAQWLAGRSGPMLRRTLRYHSLALAKRLLGDALYERARTRALADRGS